MVTRGELSVLHVLAPAPFGGLESVVRALTAGQVDRGHRVGVALVLEPGDEPPPVLGELEGEGVEATVLHNRSVRFLREIRVIRRLRRELGADVLHTHGYRPDILTGFGGAAGGAARVSTVHGFTGGGWRMRLYEGLQRRALGRFDAVVAVSASLGRRLGRTIPPDRVRVVVNRWRPGDIPLMSRDRARRELGLGTSSTVAGWVGRMSREKGPDLFLDAIERLDGTGIRGSLVGDGSSREQLRASAEARGLADRLHWHGRIPEAGRLFPAFDVFVLSSRTEGTPVVLFEAMEAGVPIVATAVGGVPEVLSGDEAVLVPPEDPEALADGVRRVLEKPEEARARAERARSRLREEFSVSEWVRRYDEVYRSAMRRSRGR